MAAFINAAVEHAERKASRSMPVPPFDFASLPRLSQLRILLGAGQLEPRFSPVWATVTLALMRQIGQWMMRMMEHHRTIREVDQMQLPHR